ncbi:MAG TPA: S41 family peptidase, partial [Ktedonobacteraceae bacterium]|nr:S41 family peptidase [Ktedonobacteraceae bacterium]
QNYVDRKAINYQEMSYDAIRAMLADLHDKGHTYFLSPDELKAQQQELSGSSSGIGIYIQQDPKTNNIIIEATVPGAPADKAGFKSGDIIKAVDGTSTAGKSMDAVHALIDGKVGTTVAITVLRPSTGQTLTIKVQRANFTIPNVILHYIAETHIAHIQVLGFDNGVSDQLKTALIQAKKDGATGIILDLRDNPGGYLTEAINTASLFLSGGKTVLLEQDSTGNRTADKTTGSPVDTQIPLVVLVNGNTASAAEIVSGALQDNKRATIIGTTTLGTGTVLNEFDLPDGSAIFLGVMEWLTPDGHFIRDKGITPNVVVTLPANNNALTPNVENQQNLTLQQILQSGDTQLINAIKNLQGH